MTYQGFHESKKYTDAKTVSIVAIGSMVGLGLVSFEDPVVKDALPLLMVIMGLSCLSSWVVVTVGRAIVRRIL